jgi:hypothetical protein
VFTVTLPPAHAGLASAPALDAVPAGV